MRAMSGRYGLRHLFFHMIKDENFIPEVIQRLTAFNGSKARAGILDGGKMGMIAHVQEYGATITPKNGDYLMIPMPDGSFRKLKSVTIPARPYIAQAVTRHQAEWKNKAKDAFMEVISGSNGRASMQMIANKMSQDIKETISGGSFAANAPLTVAIKGSSKPLIDTGGLRAAVRGEVE